MEFHLKNGIQYCKHFNILQSIFSPLPRNKDKGGGGGSRLGGVSHTLEHFHDAQFFAFVLVGW